MRHLITASIFLFCGVMTTLLVRSVYFPDSTALSRTSPRAVFELVASRDESSDLILMDGRHPMGSINITPFSKESNLVGTRLEKLPVRFRARLASSRNDDPSAQPILINGNFVIGAEGTTQEINLDINIAVAGSWYHLHVSQEPGKEWPSILLERDSEPIFSANAGEQPDASTRMLLHLALSAAGMDLETFLKSRASAPPVTVTASAGRLEAAGQDFDGVVLAAGEGSHIFKLYLDNTGRILRIDTPLGLQAVGVSLLPDVILPDRLNVHSMNPIKTDRP